MKTFFILSTAVTILLIFDVSFTEVTAAKTVKNKSSRSDATEDRVTAPNSIDRNLGINPNGDDSDETEPPKTLSDSGRRVVKTVKKMATRRSVGLINGITGFLKKTDGAFNFFGNFLREQASNVNDVAKESFGMVSGFGNSSARGARNVIKSGRTIGAQGAKELDTNWQRMTKLGKNATKLGGTAVGTPISIGEDVLATANRVARVPIRISKTITNGAIKPVLGMLGTNSDEEVKEEDGNGNEEQEVSEEIVEEEVVGVNTKDEKTRNEKKLEKQTGTPTKTKIIKKPEIRK